MRLVRWLVFLVLLGVFVTCVWPTRFRYDHMSVDSSSSYPVRIDRLNGNADMLVPDQGWIPVEGTDPGPGNSPAARRS